MPSRYFRIEVYGKGNFGCPEFGLMGYTDINILIEDCWDYYHQEHSEDEDGNAKENNKDEN